MAVYIRVDRDINGSTETTTYRNLRSVSFAPEYDPTLETLPVCQFSAEIVTDDEVVPEQFQNCMAWLCHEKLDNQSITVEEILANDYIITDVTKVSKNVLSIVAKSCLTVLEKRELEAKIYNTTSYNFMQDCFYGQTINDNSEIWTFTDENVNNRYVFGFFNKQTALERVRMMCQYDGFVIQQWGTMGTFSSSTSLSYKLKGAEDNKYSYYRRLVPLENTFKDPVVRKLKIANSVTVTYYMGFTHTDHTDDPDWKKIIVSDSYDLNNGLYVDGEAVFAQQYQRIFKNPSQKEHGQYITIDNTLCIHNWSQQEGELSQGDGYFSGYEVELDVLYFPVSQSPEKPGEHYYSPMQRVQFYLDPKTICDGFIKSANYHFGKAERISLVIVTDLVPVAASTLKFVYEYGGRKLGEREYYYPNGSSYSVTHPNIDVDVVDTIETFTPQTAQSTGTLNSDTTITIQYTRS